MPRQKGHILNEKERAQLEEARSHTPPDWNAGTKCQWKDKEKARAAGIKSGIVNRMRREMRAKMLQEAIDNGIDKLFGQSLKGLDLEGMKVVSEAMHLVGIDYAASEEAVQKIKADIKSDNKVNGDVNINIKGLDIE